MASTTNAPATLALWVSRPDLQRTRWVSGEAPTLDDGQALLHIDRLALTANNVTYGVFGDAMHYWDFFPTGDAGWGQIPTWGFADVVASKAVGVRVGQRVYGYLPIARTLVVTPARVGAGGFSDDAPHRATLNPVYNRYTDGASDPLYRPDLENLIAVLRPLFTTSFLVDDFLHDQAFFGATQVVLSSASSKTAYGTAWQLSQRAGLRVLGLTSPRHVDFVRGLGVYHRVEPYDAVAQLPRDRTVYVDFSGSTNLRRSVHTHFDAQLAYSCAVGATDWTHAGGREPLPGPKPQLFWAPGQVQKRQTDWGRDGLAERLGHAWRAFTDAVTDPRAPWLVVREVRGRAAIEAALREMVAGAIDPRTAIVLRMGDDAASP